MPKLKNDKLFKAIENGDVIAASMILASVASDKIQDYLDEGNDDGETPLHAIYLTNHGEHIVAAMESLLHSYKANQTALDHSGFTPQHYKQDFFSQNEMDVLEDRRMGIFRDPDARLSEGSAEAVVAKINAEKNATKSSDGKNGR